MRDCGAEPLPAAETGEAEQGPRSVFCKGATTPAAKAGNRNQRNFCHAYACRNGFPLKRVVFDTLRARPCGQALACIFQNIQPNSQSNRFQPPEEMLPSPLSIRTAPV